MERLEDLIIWAATAVLTSVSGGAWWLIRRIFTNQKQIEMLQADLRQQQQHRDEQRKEDRERVNEVKAGVERIEGILMSDQKGSGTR